MLCLAYQFGYCKEYKPYLLPSVNKIEDPADPDRIEKFSYLSISPQIPTLIKTAKSVSIVAEYETDILMTEAMMTQCSAPDDEAAGTGKL